MELASRIVSALLGLAVTVFILWPIAIPVGFGEIWRASRQAQSRSETPQPANDPLPEAKPAAASPQAAAPAPSPHAVLPSGAAPKPAQMARENTDAEKLAALKEKDATAAVAPQLATKRYYRITVRDGGELQSGGVVIRLAGIAARDADAICKDEKGKTWPCGAAAKAALTRLIHARAVTCDVPKGGEHNIFIARCSVAGIDLSTWLVRQGWATPNEPKEPALAEAAEAAKSEKIGAWRGGE